jgi:hypothetical protein
MFLKLEGIKEKYDFYSFKVQQLVPCTYFKVQIVSDCWLLFLLLLSIAPQLATPYAGQHFSTSHRYLHQEAGLLLNFIKFRNL